MGKLETINKLAMEIVNDEKESYRLADINAQRIVLLSQPEGNSQESDQSKKVVGGFKLYQSEGNGYTIGMTKGLDKENRIIFIGMLAESTARELGITLKQFTEMMLSNAEVAPMEFNDK